MKTINLALILFILISASLQAQDNNNDLNLTGSSKGGLYVDLGFINGFFYPSAVNDFIVNDLPSNFYVTEGTTDMFMNFSFAGGLSYIAKNNIGLKGLAVFSIAPKMITVTNGDVYTYTLWKVSPTAILSYYIPVGPIIKFGPGIGISGNLIGFNGQSEFSVGGRGQLELLLMLGDKVNVSGFTGVDFAKVNVLEEPKELNFTSFILGMSVGIKLK
jgi:hypothetical protein